ncbi:hypothetical protein ACWGQ5_07975 [Streptomyces sp. NPDC055722]
MTTRAASRTSYHPRAAYTDTASEYAAPFVRQEGSPSEVTRTARRAAA